MWVVKKSPLGFRDLVESSVEISLCLSVMVSWDKRVVVEIEVYGIAVFALLYTHLKCKYSHLINTLIMALILITLRLFK